MGNGVSMPHRSRLPTLPSSNLISSPMRRSTRSIEKSISPFRSPVGRVTWSNRTLNTSSGVTTEHLHKLVEASVAASADPSPGDLFVRIEGLLCELLNATSVRLFYVSQWHRTLMHFILGHTAPEGVLGGCEGASYRGYWDDCWTQTQVGDLNVATPATTAALSGEPVHVHDCTWYSDKNGTGVKVYFPMVHVQRDEYDGETKSTLAVAEIYKDNAAFSADALHLLEIAIFMATSWVHRTLTTMEDIARCRAAEALLCICQISPRGMNFEDLVEEIVSAALHFTEADAVKLYFVDAMEGILWSASGQKNLTIPIGKGLVGCVASSGQPINTPNCSGDKRFNEQYDGPSAFIHTAICMPIPPPSIDANNPPKLPPTPSVRRASAMNLRDLRNELGEEIQKRNYSTGVSGHVYFDPLNRSRHSVHRTYSSIDVTPRGKDVTPRIRSTKRHRTPRAVLVAYNKRGGEVFEQLDEELMRVFCTEAELLLQQKEAEATMIRRRQSEGSQDAFAKVQSSILFQYSNPIDLSRFMNLVKPMSSLKVSKPTNLTPTPVSLNGRDSETSSHVEKEGIKWEDSSCSGDLKLMNWELNPFTTEVDVKCRMIEEMYRKLGSQEVFLCGNEVLRRFIRKVRDAYRPLPFHSFEHAFSVTHVTYMMIETAADIKGHLTPHDLLSALTAALCHDLDHPGNNNAFEVNSLSPLALLHADDAVLERHHVHVAFSIILDKGAKTNILEKLDMMYFLEVRKMIIRAILSTDMSQHLQHCSRATVLGRRAVYLRKAREKSNNSSQSKILQSSPTPSSLGHKMNLYEEPPMSVRSVISPHSRRKSCYHKNTALELQMVPRGGRPSVGTNSTGRPKKTASGRALNFFGDTTELSAFDEDHEDINTEFDEVSASSISTGMSESEDDMKEKTIKQVRAVSNEREFKTYGSQRSKVPYSSRGSMVVSPKGSTKLSNPMVVRNRSSRSKIPSTVSDEQIKSPFLIGDSFEDRSNLVDLIVHCADLSGQIMTTSLALEWGRRILQEFKDQSKKEEELNLPVTFEQFNDETQIIRGQLFFLEKIVVPLWEPMFEIFPELNKDLQGNLDRNIVFYERAIRNLESRRISSFINLKDADVDNSMNGQGAIEGRAHLKSA